MLKIIDLVLNLEGVLYKVSSLQISIHKSEFFYHFVYPTDTKRKFLNYNAKKVTGRPDHISFHLDGTVHLTLNGKEYLNSGQFADKIFLPKQKKITPLLIHSLFAVEGNLCLPKYLVSEKYPNDRIIQQKIVSQENKPFSIILFLVPKEINIYKYLPLASELKGLYPFISDEILAWNEWLIDCVITDVTLPIYSNSLPFQLCQAFAYENLYLALKDLLLRKRIMTN